MKDPYKTKVVELVERLFKEYNLNYSKAGRQIIRDGKPMSRQSLWKMVLNGSLKLSTFLEILDANGISVRFIMEKPDVNLRNGFGERVIQEISGKVFDTWKCSAVSTSFYSDGKSRYTNHFADELYIDLDGNALLVHYTDLDESKIEDGKKYPWVELVDDGKKEEFIKKYGVI